MIHADIQVYEYRNGKADRGRTKQGAASYDRLCSPRYQTIVSADYVRDATAVVDDILARGKTPVYSGGTGLHINSVISGIQFAEQKRDDEYREMLWKMAEEKGRRSGS